ncbi:MAG TPA: hypothetical protein VD999_01820 [Vitreimonas sp.]|nr:hypothetical protein [Vitreimonas sp.]
MTFSELRTAYPRFIYQNYSWNLTDNGLELEFSYLNEGTELLAFTHRVVFEAVTSDHVAAIDPAALKTYIFNIGLVEMLSYWKATCSPEIVIEAGPLSASQIEWWHDLLMQGMGEFFFVNTIDFTPSDFVRITAQTSADTAIPTPLSSTSAGTRTLIPVGGGKDSALTIELLKQHHAAETLGCLLINPTGAAQDLAALSGLAAHRITRRLDHHLFGLNERGFLNGHVPFSASVAFISTLGARLWGYDYIAISNERSSNEGSVWFHDHYINHQYSKTFEFESNFQTYLRQIIADPQLPLYFSFLRPLYELQIAQVFAKVAGGNQPLLTSFRSCNRGQKQNIWCGECPKCLFAYAILYPFLSHESMVKIFGQDLWANQSLWPIAAELLGYAEKKPLECVGTHEENVSAFWLSAEKLRADDKPLPALLQQAFNVINEREQALPGRADAVLHSWNPEHSLPTQFEKTLRAALDSPEAVG